MCPWHRGSSTAVPSQTLGTRRPQLSRHLLAACFCWKSSIRPFPKGVRTCRRSSLIKECPSDSSAAEHRGIGKHVVLIVTSFCLLKTHQRSVHSLPNLKKYKWNLTVCSNAFVLYLSVPFLSALSGFLFVFWLVGS